MADSGEPAVISALNQLQGRVPNVLATAALAATIALATLRAQVVWRWLGYLSALAAVVFLLGFIIGVVGSTPEGGSSVFGIAAFTAWMLLVTAGLWRASKQPQEKPSEQPTPRTRADGEGRERQVNEDQVYPDQPATPGS
jgi:hypothetical protein